MNFVEDFFIQHFDSLSSTQDYAKYIIDGNKLNKPNTVIIANEQTEGKGRYQRQWVSSPGNLHLTIILPLPENAHQICFVTGLAVLETIKTFIPGSKPQLKWVNDILIHEKKVCGILLERFQNFILVGIGVNILDNPNLGKINATNLNNFTEVDKETFQTKLLNNFKSLYNMWSVGNFVTIKNKWHNNAYKLGEEITVNYPDDKSDTGVMVGISDLGELILNTNGGVKYINSGELFSL